MKTKNKIDVYQMVTDRIIEFLENQNGSEWLKPWQTFGRNRNLATNRQYDGFVNQMLLGITSWQKGYELPLWVGFKQLQSLGGSVREGEKGALITFYKLLTRADGDVAESSEPEADNVREIPMLRYWYVWNIEQTDLDKANYLLYQPRDNRVNVKAARFIKNIPMKLRHFGDRAYYSPKTDTITIPKLDMFNSYTDYVATALHEAIHWTESRTNRRDLIAKRYSPEHHYAIEEIVAEIGAAYATSHLNIQGKLQHSEYIANWMSVMKNDKKAVFFASRLAKQAFEFLLNFQNKNKQPLDIKYSTYCRPLNSHGLKEKNK